MQSFLYAVQKTVFKKNTIIYYCLHGIKVILVCNRKTVQLMGIKRE